MPRGDAEAGANAWECPPDGMFVVDYTQCRVEQFNNDCTYLETFIPDLPGGRSYDLAFSPDGRYLVVLTGTGGQGGVMSYDAQAGAFMECLLPQPSPTSSFSAIEWRSNGKLYLTLCDPSNTPHGSVLEYDWSAGTSQVIVTDLDVCGGLSFTPGGNMIVSEPFANRVREYQYAGGTWLETSRSPLDVTYPNGTAVGPDGRLYVARPQANQVEEYELQGEPAVWTLIGALPCGPLSGAVGLTIGPDDDLYISLSYGNAVKRFDLQARTCEACAYYEPFGEPANVAFRPIVDCNGNCVSDVTELNECDGSPWCSDCNANGILDVCDIENGRSTDCNTNGIPDDCETGLVPTVTTQPLAQTRGLGNTATFGVIAEGFGTLAYQWYHNDVPLLDDGRISGATTPLLTIDFASIPDSGTYYVVVTNDCGSVASDAVTLTIETCVGDLSFDGEVDFGDINPFVLYLLSFGEWQNAHPGCDPAVGDINGDGAYPSFGDINAFVNLLTSGAHSCGPVAHYPFDGNAADASGHGHDLTLHAGATFAAGHCGTGALDTRLGHADTPHAAELELPNSYTVAAWARVDGPDLNACLVGMHYCTVDTDHSWTLSLQADPYCHAYFRNFISGGYAQAYQTDGAWVYNTWDPAWGDVGYGPTTCEIGDWVHLTFVYDKVAAMASIYVNGDLVRQGAWVSECGGSAAALAVGTDHLRTNGGLCGSNHYFQGEIDELRIYNRALSPEEIVVLFNCD